MSISYELKTSSNQTYANTGLRFFNTVHFFLGFLLLLWLNNGFFSYISPYFPGVLRWMVFLAWMGISIMKSRIYLFTLIKHSWTLLLLISYIFVISFFNNEFYISSYISSFLYLFIIYSVFLFYFQERHLKFLKLLAGYFFIEYTFIAINTFVKLQQNPLIARILTADTSTIEANLGVLRLAGIGNYAYFYSLVAIILVLVYTLIYYPKNKFVSLSLIVLFSLSLFKASFTLSLLFAGIFIVLIALKRYTKYTIVTMPLLVFFVYVLHLNGKLAMFFVRLSEASNVSPEVSIRFMEVADFLSGNSVNGSDLGSRLNLYTQSIEAFFSHIFIGTSFSLNTTFVAGDHSAWLDLLARLGLVSVLLFVFLFNVYKYTTKNMSTKAKRIVTICWLYFISVGIVNTLFFASIFTVWIFFLPVIAILIDKKDGTAIKI